MEYINIFIKGVIIGIGKIIPGVSGSMLAISLGVYEKMLSSISTLFKDFKENAKFLMNIGIGIVLAIILMSKMIIYLLNKHYFLVMFFFIGLIFGTLFPLFKKVKENIKLKYMIFLFIPFLIMIFINTLINNINIKIKLTLFSSFLLGIIEAITMIIPGISGTAIMMMLGIYEEQLKMFNEIEYLPYLLFFIVGILLSVILISKLIIKFINKYRIFSYYLIIGFSLMSTIFLLKLVLVIDFIIVELILGVVLMSIGTFISYKLE